MTTYILCRSQSVPTHEQMAEALRGVGYDAHVENIGGNSTTSLNADIRYALNKLPIVVDVMHDLIDDVDEGDEEYWNWLRELVPQERARLGLRRFIFVRHVDSADASAVTTVTDFLRDRTNGLIIAEQLSAKS